MCSSGRGFFCLQASQHLVREAQQKCIQQDSSGSSQSQDMFTLCGFNLPHLSCVCSHLAHPIMQIPKKTGPNFSRPLACSVFSHLQHVEVLLDDFQSPFSSKMLESETHRQIKPWTTLHPHTVGRTVESNNAPL